MLARFRQFSLRTSLTNAGVRLKDYWLTIYGDYRTVAVETVTDARDKPVKATACLVGLGGLLYAYKSNPDYDHYVRHVCDARLDTSLVSDLVRNPSAADHIYSTTRLVNQGRLRVLNLILMSLVWEDDYADGVDLYSAHCASLRPRWRDIIPDRIVDVGAFGRWWILDKRMVDYDINVDELKDLPD